MLFLPDTNILIKAFLGKEPYASWFVDHFRKKEIILSAIVISEYLSGAKSSEREGFEKILTGIEICPVDVAVAKIAAGYRREYSKKTKKVWLFDCLIAASCKVFGATLVTSDRKDYPMKNIRVKVF
ncbi:MAG: PIN domain-containing protein [bacterium]|nr:PIN domain-containing protein [bacterium]